MPTSPTPPETTFRSIINDLSLQQKEQIAFLFTDGSQACSWYELYLELVKIAQYLAGHGAASGDPVIIMMPSGKDALMAILGTIYGGYQAVVINLAAGDSAIGYALEHSCAGFAFVGKQQIDQFNRLGSKNIIKCDLIGTKRGKLADVMPTDDALLMYTSGTTGTPKGVVHSQASLLAGGWTTALAHRLTCQDRGLCVLPLCHINGLCVSVISTLISGSSLIIAPGFSVSTFWQDIASYRATWFSAVPTIISHLLHSAEMPAENTRMHLRFGRSASAPLAPEIQSGFEERFSLPIIETMGLTETAAQILSNPLPPAIRKSGSAGIAYGNQVAVLTQEGEKKQSDGQGEIIVKGPNLMREYLRNQSATSESFTADGWLRTGDLGRIDADGYVFVTGRIKELIIKGGENIAPREVDEALYSHPDVVEAAAFARSCLRYGETVEAAVVLTEGSTLTAAELLDTCRLRLGDFKCPDIVHIVADLPKGPSGKIQRLKMAELL